MNRFQSRVRQDIQREVDKRMCIALYVY
jgi:hypothetical protein